jgi:hypothetical protein
MLKTKYGNIHSKCIQETFLTIIAIFSLLGYHAQIDVGWSLTTEFLGVLLGIFESELLENGRRPQNMRILGCSVVNEHGIYVKVIHLDIHI